MERVGDWKPIGLPVGKTLNETAAMDSNDRCIGGLGALAMGDLRCENYYFPRLKTIFSCQSWATSDI